MEEQLECPVCFDRFETPRVLPCQHTFCTRCLLPIEKNVRGTIKVKCPECRAEHCGRANSFPINITMQRMLSAAPLPNVPAQNIQGSNARRNGQEGGECDWNMWKMTFLEYFQKVRRGIRKVVSGFLRRFTQRMMLTIIIFILITLSRLIAGSVMLSSDCPKEKHVAEYLFAKFWFAIIFWVTLLVLRCNERLVNAMDNLFIEFYVVLVEGLFSLIWLIVGTVWTIGMRNEMLDECPGHVKGWEDSFITFAMVLVIFDWLAIVAFLFCCLYILYDNSVSPVGDSTTVPTYDYKNDRRSTFSLIKTRRLAVTVIYLLNFESKKLILPNVIRQNILCKITNWENDFNASNYSATSAEQHHWETKKIFVVERLLLYGG